MNPRQRKAKQNWEYMLHQSLTDEEFLALTQPKAKATKAESQAAPVQVKRESHRCHYCGQPAYSTGFFGEWECPECGGRRY